MNTWRKSLAQIYRRHSVVMLLVWILVGFYADNIKGVLIALGMYLIVAPFLIYGFEFLVKSLKKKKVRQLDF